MAAAIRSKAAHEDLSGPARGTRETAVMDRDELFVRLRRGDTLQQMQTWLSACRTAPQPRAVAVPLLGPKKDQKASGAAAGLSTHLNFHAPLRTR